MCLAIMAHIISLGASEECGILQLTAESTHTHTRTRARTHMQSLAATKTKPAQLGA